MIRSHAALFVVVALAGCSSAAETPFATEASLAVVRTTWPATQDPGPPFYTRIDPVPPHVFSDGEWTAVLFYRDPSCVPEDFNLLAFFDAPAAFGCTPLVSGASLWNGAVGVGSPRVVTSSGSPVVWLVPTAGVTAAMADGILTVTELAGIAGVLAGTAQQFHETLHPHPLPDFLGGGGHPNPGITLVARGQLGDGRSFQFQVNRSDRGADVVRISIR